MNDITNVDPRELIRGLMRGNKSEFKLGYSHEAATEAAFDVQNITEDDERAELREYAEGFAAGMAEPRDLINPAGVE